MIVRIIKFKQFKDMAVNVIAEFNKVSDLNLDNYPIIYFYSHELKNQCKMKVPDDCYLVTYDK